MDVRFLRSPGLSFSPKNLKFLTIRLKSEKILGLKGWFDGRLQKPARYHGVLGPHYKHQKKIVPKPSALKLVTDDQVAIDPKQLEMKKKNIPWARLLARVFNIDVEICSKCSGKMKIIAAIEDPKVIRKILDQSGLPSRGYLRPLAKRAFIRLSLSILED